MRHRVLERPLGSKIGYHELEDEKEEADEEWMTGEASQLSGAGTRGSSNWVLKIMLPIFVSCFAFCCLVLCEFCECMCWLGCWFCWRC